MLKTFQKALDLGVILWYNFIYEELYAVCVCVCVCACVCVL